MADRRYAATHVAAPVVGRDDELEAIDTFLAAPWPRLLLLEGPAGIGKTTLLETALRRAAEHGAAPLVARPSLAERELPFAALASLLDARIEAVLPGLAPPRRRALEIALRRAPAESGELDRAALGLAVLDAIRAVARPIPALVVVDDLQWCDEPTAAALAFALRRAGSEPFAVLGGVRTGIASAALDHVTQALPVDLVDRLAVGPLSLGAIRRIVEQRTGRVRGRALVARVADAAGGNPLLALELVRAIDAAGHDPAPGESLAVPASAEPLIAERLGALSRSAEDAVLAVALAGRASVGEVLAAAGDPGPGLDEALRAGLVELDDDLVRLGHPLVGAAAVGRATPERRRVMHGRLAPLAGDLEARARHLALAAGGPDGEAAAACDAAAHDAERRGAPEAAAELAELAVGLSDPDDRPRIASRRCRAMALRVAVGDPVRARQHLDEGLRAVDAPASRVPLLLVGVELAHLVGGRPAARRAAEIALAGAGDDPILRARAHAAMLAWGAEDTREERRHATAALELLAGREAEAPEAAADVLAILADARLAAGEGPAFDLLERALELDRARPDFVVGSLEILAGNLRTADRIEEARDCWAESLARLERAGYESRRASTLMQAGFTELLAGDHRAAGELFDSAHRLALELGADTTGPRLYRAHLDALLGDREAVRQAATAGLGDAESAANPWVVALWHRTLGIDALAAGEPGVAADHLRRTLDAALSLGIREPNWARIDADLVEALVGAGRLAEAEAALADFGARASTARLPWAAVAHARATAVLRATHHDLEGALAALDRVAGPAAALPLALERARVDLVRGSLLRRLRRVREARSALQAARSAFAAAPSAPWEARAAAELARLGGRAPARSTLTPAERQVAEMAAAGRSNRQIAEGLVLSVRTVESQLSSAYGKLGVRGRTALARALDEGSTADA
jgi:DNA-binding CsgD family transcriptional regulator